MIQINLLPQVKKDLMHARVVKNRVIFGSIVISIISISVLVLLAIYTYGYQSIAANTLIDNNEKNANTFLKTKDLSKLLTLQNQLSAISTINQNRNINSRFNDMINKINPATPNDVQYSSIIIDSTTQTITIEGQTSGFPSYETFKKTLDNAQVKYTDANDKEQSVKLAKTINISSTSLAIDSSGKKVLSFTMSFVYTPEFLSPASKNATIVIEGTGNVTDSYQGVPQSLFVNKPTTIEGGQ